ncbi:WXG100 family type VII secretion target [Streptomyces sp. NPDC096198]|uniref:WXG100 family type VII secretion target n=1 Tax=Streptomyces sp. NPDC096198 TaxID=3366080 RepID=UPI0037FA628D
MAFEVEPDDLDGYGRQVGRAADDMHQAQEYIKKYGDMGAFTGQGLFLWATSMHAQAMSGVHDVVTRLHSILAASAQELSKSADYYRTTDQHQASQLDATYPPSKR